MNFPLEDHIILPPPLHFTSGIDPMSPSPSQCTYSILILTAHFCDRFVARLRINAKLYYLHILLAYARYVTPLKNIVYTVTSFLPLSLIFFFFFFFFVLFEDFIIFLFILVNNIKYCKPQNHYSTLAASRSPAVETMPLPRQSHGLWVGYVSDAVVVGALVEDVFRRLWFPPQRTVAVKVHTQYQPV